MSVKDKVLNVLAIVTGIIAIFFAIADFAELFPCAEICWEISFGVVCFVEAVKYWNKKRTSAIIELVCGIVFFGLAVVNFFI